MRTANVRPKVKRPAPVYVVGTTPVDARNRSCVLMGDGYERVGVREGFVMLPRHNVGTVAPVVVLFPEYANTRI